MVRYEYKRKISAYFSKNNLKTDNLQETVDKEKEYYQKYTEQEFDELIKKHYDIKGEVTPEKILKAKSINSIPTEYEEQKKLVKWLRDNKIRCQSSGNGFKLDTKNNVHYMAKLKATGLSVGFPDLEVFIGNGKVLYIEMKRSKGGKVSDEQHNWINWLNSNGYIASVCNGANEAIKLVTNYLK